MPRSQTVYYGLLDDVRNGVLDPFNITGYYVYASGQAICKLERGPSNVVRMPRANFAGIASNPSLSTLKSSPKMVEWLIDRKILQGERIHYPSKIRIGVRNADQTEMAEKGYVPSHIIFASPRFKAWHRKIRAQIKQIIDDRKDFKQDSETSESIESIKQVLVFISQKRQWGPAELEAIVKQAYEEFTIEHTMNA